MITQQQHKNHNLGLGPMSSKPGCNRAGNLDRLVGLLVLLYWIHIVHQKPISLKMIHPIFDS